MMARGLITFLLMLLAPVAARAEYLYWQITSETLSQIAGSGVKDAEYAAMWVVDEDGELVYDDPLVDIHDAGAYSIPMDNESSIDLSTISDVTAYSFYIELYNSSGDVVGMSETVSYSTLRKQNFIDTGLTPTLPDYVWHGGTYMIPEPTTGMLVMFGFGLLALKRREKVGPPEGRREIS